MQHAPPPVTTARPTPPVRRSTVCTPNGPRARVARGLLALTNEVACPGSAGTPRGRRAGQAAPRVATALLVLRRQWVCRRCAFSFFWRVGALSGGGIDAASALLVAWVMAVTACTTAGYYCPSGTSSATQNQCPAGSYCPAGSSAPTSASCRPTTAPLPLPECPRWPLLLLTHRRRQCTTSPHDDSVCDRWLLLPQRHRQCDSVPYACCYERARALCGVLT